MSKDPAKYTNSIWIPSLIIGFYIILLSFLHITVIAFYYLHKTNLQYIHRIVDHSYSYNLLFVLILLEVLIITMLFIYGWTVYSLILPLRKIKKSAERLGVDINSSPLRTNGKGLISHTVNALNKMQDKIKTLINVRSQMLATISHDLRTPITRIRLRAQLLPDSDQSQKIIHDLDEMETMINNVLNYARYDFLNEKKSKIDLGSFITSLFYDYQDTAQKVSFAQEDIHIPFIGRPQALRRCFSNIINNALKYAGAVFISIELKKECTIICIEDNGPGIPEDELDKVIKPFYRVKESRKQSSTGVGLGLAIAAEIIQSHDGQIVLSNRAAGGLCVAITLPKIVY